MPLLRRQPFVKDPPPPGLKDEDEVFVCQLTGEMFLDYEKFFERVILCNSLVWTCELTGKSGLTYQEALDSEKKAAKTVASLPDSLQKPILYLSTLTHRSRLNDLNEDIYSYVKDRYFIGETVEVLQKNEKRTCKVIKVISPASARAANGKADSVVSVSDDDSDVVCLDDPPKAEKKGSAVADSELPKPEDYEYVCQQLKKNNLYVVKADCISRAKGRYTREKSRMYLKANCAASASGIWKVKDKLLKNFKISEVKFSTFFDGPEPTFTISEAKRKPSGMKTGSFIDLTDEDQAIRQAKKVMKEKKKLIKETKKLEKLNRKDLKKKEKMAMKKKQKQQAKGDVEIALLGLDHFTEAESSIDEKEEEISDQLLNSLEEQLSPAEQIKKPKKKRKPKSEKLGSNPVDQTSSGTSISTEHPDASTCPSTSVDVSIKKKKLRKKKTEKDIKITDAGPSSNIDMKSETFSSPTCPSGISPKKKKSRKKKKCLKESQINDAESNNYFDMKSDSTPSPNTPSNISTEKNKPKKKKKSENDTVNQMTNKDSNLNSDSATSVRQQSSEEAISSSFSMASPNMSLNSSNEHGFHKYKQMTGVDCNDTQAGTSASLENSGLETEQFDHTLESAETSAAEPNFDELRKMSAEERQALKEKEKAEKLAARLILKEELKKKMKEESQKRKEERDKEREKRKEEKKLQEEYLKEWSKPRDDMECDDLKDLPVPVPVRSRIPMDLFGDSLMVLEYLHSFDELLDLDNLLPNGLSLNELGKALQETDANGPYYDLLRMFLLLLFQLQEEEDDEDEGDEDEGNDTGAPELFEDQSFKELVRAATKAAQLPQMNYGTPLRKLPLNNFTMTEILRLHFLSSGAKGSDENIRFRYQQRGAYTPHDDAGLEFKRQEVGILKSLGEKNVFDLNPGEKLKILTALIHQVLTFVATRDIIEDNFDKLKSAQGELRNHRFKEHRREKDEATFWYKKRLEERAREKELEQQKKEGKKKAKLDKLAEEENGIKPSADAQDGEQSTPKDQSMEKDSPQQPEAERHSTRHKEKMESKFDDDFFESAVENIQWEKITPEDRIRMKEKHTKKECELMELVDEAQHGTVICPVGRDRTFRRYWMFRSVPGLFVEDHDEFVMDDLLQPVPQIKSEKEGNKGTQDEKSTSDKENDSFDQGKDADTRPPTPIQVDESLVNGKTKPVLADTDNIKKDPDVVEVLEDKTSETKMSIHEQISQRNQVVWAYYTPEQIDTLIESLNPRGFREGSLKAALVEQKSFLIDRVKETPTDVLDVNKNSPHKKSIKYQSIKSRNKVTQGAVNNASAEEFLELNLREALLDIEERIYVGSLGTLKVKDRLKWRDAIENGAYKALCEELTWCGNSLDMTQPPKVVVKPKAVVNGDDPNGSLEEIDDDPSPAIQDLTKALLQIEQSLEEKYLGVPIGIIEDKKQKQKTKGKNTKVKGKDKEDDGDSSDDDESVDKDKDTQKTARERWEISLMASTSFSQLFLHLGTLESSVTWSKSTLHARCHICRRKGDGEKMLLCDGCDRGHHMYCLKPQVKNVPRGDWFCPDCRPKDVPKTPRKRRKSVFEEEEEETEESVSSEDDDSSDDDDDSSSDSDDDDSDEETEEETEEETTPQPAKIKFVKGNKKQAAQPSKAPAGRSRKSLETSQPSSRASSQERDRASSKSRGKAAEATSKPVKRKLEVEQKTKSKGNSRKSLDETVLKKGRRSPPQPENTKGSRRSLDSVKIPAKRKRDEEEEEMPDRKKGLTKSRGGDKEQAMKICEDLLVEVTGKKESWPFMMPVSKRDAPDYFDIIKRPMDFSTIKNKVNRFEYLTPAELLEDIRVTLRNCEQYNMPTAPEYQAGQKLSRFLEKRVKECNLVSLINKKSPKKGDSPKSPAKRQTRTR